MRSFFLGFILLFSLTSFSQRREITGFVLDANKKPLENATVMAQPKDKSNALKFAIADDKGRYKLFLDNNIAYTLLVSYIGFDDENLEISATDSSKTHDFNLKGNNEKLQEIVIKYDVKPLIIKKDTMEYKVSSFTNGTERKLKDQLKKLPGVEVDKNGGVTVQGKSVTSFLVEGKPFFGGGTKLGVENIPADAVDKVEVLDHFTDTGFMKKVSGSKELAMNIKLKKDKKKFTFGDVTAASGPPNFYKAHTGLFYYQPDTNLSLIGDVNNTSESVLDYNDLLRFEKGSDYFQKNSSSFDLYSFAMDNDNLISNKTKFVATNFFRQITPKTEITGYVLYNNSIKETKNESFTNYLQNAVTTFENSTNLGNTNTNFLLSNLKLKFNPNLKQRINYDASFKITKKESENLLNTISSNNSNFFDTNNKNSNLNFKQFLEWHKAFTNNKTTTFAINHSYTNQKVNTNWVSTNPFLPSFLTLQNDINFNVNQDVFAKINSIEALFKYYWIVNNRNHIYFNVGNSNNATIYTKDENQKISNGLINNFSNFGFGNNLKYNFNDAFAGLEYKFLYKKFITKINMYLHQYNLKIINFQSEYNTNKLLFEPEFNAEYDFSQAHIVSVDYKLSNEFATYDQLASGFALQNYNTVYKGNEKLENAKIHQASISYKYNNLFYGILSSASLNYIKKETSFRDVIVFQGINQFSTPILTTNPDENLSFSSRITKNIYKFNIGFNTRISHLSYTQNLNNLENKVNRNSQNIGITLKTNETKWPYLTFKYNKSFNTFSSSTTSKFTSDIFSIDYEVAISKEINFKADYDFNQNKSSNNEITNIQTANATLEYKKDNSAWSFELSAKNIFNTGIIKNNYFTDFQVTNQTTYILPRIVMISVSYKL